MCSSKPLGTTNEFHVILFRPQILVPLSYKCIDFLGIFDNLSNETRY